MKEIKDKTSHNHDQKQSAQGSRDVRSSEQEALHEYEEKYKRLSADFANYKKRVERESAELEQRVKDNFLKSMLPIIDDFIRLNDHVIQYEPLAKGVQAIQKKWQQWLESNHVQVINPEHEEFDHNLHHAVMHRPVDDPELDGKIVQVIEYGYRRRDKVLRHAKVAVARYMKKVQLTKWQHT
ncbi:MAG: nucleotide exchange factor GrpE [bacterium]